MIFKSFKLLQEVSQTYKFLSKSINNKKLLDILNKVNISHISNKEIILWIDFQQIDSYGDKIYYPVSLQ